MKKRNTRYPTKANECFKTTRSLTSDKCILSLVRLLFKQKRSNYMNEIMNNTANQTPIEIALGIDEEGMTTVKRLFDFLGMSRNNYSRWYKTNIADNQFAEEGIDYFPFLTNEECGGQASYDCKITANFAKKLSMQSKTAKGEQARQYFLKVEEKMKEAAHRIAPMTPLEQLQLQANAILQVNEKVDSLDKKLDRLEADLPILGVEIEKITNAVNKMAVACLGGKNSNAYQDRSLRGKVYSDVYSELKRQFGVSTYKAIKRNQCDDAVGVIGQYKLPYILAEQVQMENVQMNLWGGAVR